MQATEMGILLAFYLLASMEGFPYIWHDTIKAFSFCFKRNFGWEMSNWISLDQLLSQMTLIILIFLFKKSSFLLFFTLDLLPVQLVTGKSLMLLCYMLFLPGRGRACTLVPDAM